VQWRRQNVGPIGIDIGARCIRAAQVREHANGCALTAAGRVEMAPGGERDTAAVQAAIARVLAEKRFSGKRVVTCLPASSVQIKTMRLPRMPEEELLAAGELEARERFSELGDAMIRVFPAGLVGRAGAEQYELIVMAARRDAVEARLKLLTGLGLTVTSIESCTHAFFRPFARFLERSDDAEQASAFVDIGGRGSRIIIARGSEIVFLKGCPVGGEAIDRAAAEALSLPIEQASTLRMRLLSAEGDGDERAAKVRDAIGPILDQLGKEIGLCLRYYAVTFRGERPDQIGGGGAEFAFPYVAQRLSESTQLPVNVAPSLRGIGHEGVFDDAEVASGLPEWSVAIGLALRGQRLVAKELKVA
jgi:type IV pilus assembly protein PilM